MADLATGIHVSLHVWTLEAKSLNTLNALYYNIDLAATTTMESALLTKYDKAGAAVVAGALGTIIAYTFPMSMEVQGAVTTGLAAFLVWAFPNKET